MIYVLSRIKHESLIYCCGIKLTNPVKECMRFKRQKQRNRLTEQLFYRNNSLKETEKINGLAIKKVPLSRRIKT